MTPAHIRVTTAIYHSDVADSVPGRRVFLRAPRCFARKYAINFSVHANGVQRYTRPRVLVSIEPVLLYTIFIPAPLLRL